MSNLALYRKYRPQVFEDVIGQEHICKTLISQIKNDNIGHAYLFSGTRGVGKTSIAKIFAKAINCINNSTGSPCLKCANCIENSKSSSIDILEIDAASNNGVDNIRELKEKIQFPPVNGKYRVYIIDEVHMLSASAFNALLKTLEEPPKYAVFILATTESYKIPSTILSRCTKFDFKLVPLEDLENLVKKIFKEEGITASDEVITAMCKAGEGSVRDTLSICDMLSSYCEKNITYEKFTECMGTLGLPFIYKICKAIKEKDIEQILLQSKEICESGKNIEVLVKDMMEFYRNCLVVKTIKGYENILKLPKDDISLLKALSEISSEKELLEYLQKLAKTASELKYSLNPRLLSETTFIDMALYSEQEKNIGDIDINNLVEKRVTTILNSGIIEKAVNKVLNKGNTTIQQNNSKIENNIKLEDIEKIVENILNKKDIILNNNSSIKKSDTVAEKEDFENYEDDIIYLDDIQAGEQNSILINNVENKINRIDNSINEIELDISNKKNIEHIEQNQLNQTQDEENTTNNNTPLEEKKVVSAFIRSTRENNLGFVTISLNKCKYQLKGNILYLICSDKLTMTTLNAFTSQIEKIVKDINPDLTYKVIENNDKLKNEQIIEDLKGKFGKDLKIK